MEFDQLKEIMELFSKSNIDKLEFENETVKLELGKKPKVVNKTVEVRSSETVAVAPVVAAAPVAEEPANEAPAKDLVYVKSPIVGTFYRSPNPNAEAFVQVGDRVRVGQTLCIVEAMKLMNEIQADHAGIIEEILVENGQGVEYDQPLFSLKSA